MGSDKLNPALSSRNRTINNTTFQSRMKTIAILLLGLAGCALSNTIPPTDLGFFVAEGDYKDALVIHGYISLVNGETLEIREFEYKAEGAPKLVQVKFVGEKKDGNKVDLTFKGEDPTGEEQQLSDTRDAKSEVLLNLGNASAKDFDKILIAVADKHAAEEVWATAELKFPTTTNHGSSGSSTSQAGMLCLVVSVIAVLGH